MGVTIKDLDKPKIEISNLSTEFYRFLYFFFAPTLVYRDSYVKTHKIRWQFVFKNLITFCFLIMYLWSVFKALCTPIFRNTASHPGSWKEFISSVMFSTVSGTVCLLTLFYGVLHCWMNIFGEILRFGDRLFYEDWWNV